jgi:hypothetical protein
VLGWEAHLTRYLSKPSFQKELGRVREMFFHDVIPWSRQVRHDFRSFSFVFLPTCTYLLMERDMRAIMDREDDGLALTHHAP